MKIDKIIVSRHARERIRKYTDLVSNGSIQELVELVYGRAPMSAAAQKRYENVYEASEYRVDSDMVYVFRNENGLNILVTVFPAPFVLLN